MKRIRQRKRVNEERERKKNDIDKQTPTKLTKIV